MQRDLQERNDKIIELQSIKIKYQEQQKELERKNNELKDNVYNLHIENEEIKNNTNSIKNQLKSNFRKKIESKLFNIHNSSKLGLVINKS